MGALAVLVLITADGFVTRPAGDMASCLAIIAQERLDDLGGFCR